MTAPDASFGVIASGTIDGRSWRLDARAPGTHGVSAEQEIVGISGPGWGHVGMYQDVPALHAPSAVPVTFTGIASPLAQAQYGAIRDDVSYVKVRLSDGGVLTVHPVTLFGVRVVGFAIPAALRITEAIAYSRDGEIAVAIPFSDPGGRAYFGNWLSPGQVRPVAVGDRKFFAFGVSRGAGALSWTAYDGSGVVVESSEVTLEA